MSGGRVGRASRRPGAECMTEGESVRSIVVGAEDDPIRLDRFIAERFPDLSRSQVRKLIGEGDVLVDGQPAKASYLPEAGDVITLRVPSREVGPPRPEAMALDIVYEDDHLLVVNKPTGLVVHPSRGHPAGTLVNALLAHRPSIADADLDPQRPGIVHRLDRDTSGLLVVAADRRTQQQLQAAFKSRAVEKTYLVLVHGRLEPERGAIEAPIGRDPAHRQRMAVLREGGRYARTEYRVREYLGRYTYLEADLLTGRTHQLRVHLSAIGYPVAGDRIYGRRRTGGDPDRQFLHAWRLAFDHPATGERMEFHADLAEDLATYLARLRRLEARRG